MFKTPIKKNPIFIAVKFLDQTTSDDERQKSGSKYFNVLLRPIKSGMKKKIIPTPYPMK